MKRVLPMLIALLLISALPVIASYPFAKWNVKNKPYMDPSRAIQIAEKAVGPKYYLLGASVADDGSIKNNKPAGTWLCVFGGADGKQKQVWVYPKGNYSVYPYPASY